MAILHPRWRSAIHFAVVAKGLDVGPMRPRLVDLLIFVHTPLAKRGRHIDVVTAVRNAKGTSATRQCKPTCACQMWREAMIEDDAYSFAHPRCHFYEGHRARKLRESRCQKGNDYRSVSLSLFLPPSPLFVLLTSLRSAQANTHAFIFCLSQIFIRPRIKVRSLVLRSLA
jgi:hypothetical protein